MGKAKYTKEERKERDRAHQKQWYLDNPKKKKYALGSLRGYKMTSKWYIKDTAIRLIVSYAVLNTVNAEIRAAGLSALITITSN